MLIAVVSVFAVAFLAPWISRLFRRRAGLVVGLLPLGLTVYFASFTRRIQSGDALLTTQPWAPGLQLDLSFHLDGLSLIFALLITGIGFLIVVYTGGYLAGHPQIGRFYLYLAMFMASMLGLVLADNLILLFVFWELTSLTSYFLIGFDHEKSESRAAALQALIVTGAGGLCLLAGAVMLGQIAGTYSISDILARGDEVRSHALYRPILILILLAAFTKSAQFPFYFWLPSAMQAPTPASAYLHSATMVKAGIYLLARLSPALGLTPEWQYSVGLIGAATMVIGAALAMAQTDLKRILAYLTVSSLGTITLLIGLDTTLSMQAALVFLVAHSAYKGALFMAAGAVDHETGSRDASALGGLRHAMPITAAAAVLAGLSMAGIPPMLGFIGKELVYEAQLHARSAAWLFAGAGVAANILVGASTIFLVWGVFFGRPNPQLKAPHEAPPALWAGPAVLAVLGLFAGLFPGYLAAPLISAGVGAARAQRAEVEMAAWHGFNFVLALSLITIAGGVLVYVFRPLAVSAIMRLHAPSIGPERSYGALLDWLNAAAKAQTRLIQSGYLRLYIFFVLASLAVPLGYTLFSKVNFDAAASWGDVRPQDITIVVLIIISAFGVVQTVSRFAAVLLLGVIGYGVALIFILFGAPDLALTQFLVETLTVIILAFVLYHLPRFRSRTETTSRIRDGVVAALAGGLMAILVLAATAVTPEKQATAFYAERSLPDAHGRNLVNVILVDFRALDTLGEITVLAVAGVGVFALLKLRAKREEKA
jgi:multicomponent Na+:H+ antiporter subunit A